MDTVLRIIAIAIEVLLLAAVTYAVMNGVRLTVFDLGAGPRYKKAVAMALIAVGCIVMVFFIAHLTSFYPTI
jgi:succinate dehydrogenase/fumarate reductase cytochrome b subunit